MKETGLEIGLPSIPTQIPFVEKRKPGEHFARPVPFDLLKLSVIFDDSEVVLPPETHIPAYDPERQVNILTTELYEAYGEDLLYVGVSGSYGVGEQTANSDIDVITVIEGNYNDQVIQFGGDLKIILRDNLQEFLECGFTLIVNQFMKTRPVFQKDKSVISMKEVKPVLDKALPFLRARAHFGVQSADIYKLMSDKHKAIFMYLQGFEDSAFKQLEGAISDKVFIKLREGTDTAQHFVYGSLAQFYSVHALNRLHHAISDMSQALHVKENGFVADLKPLREFIKRVNPETGEFFEWVYQRKKECFKMGDLFLGTEYEVMRQQIEYHNNLIESLIL